jgi:Concanavalin A-like lectin/glucanases superfamily/Dockerin type I domain
MNPIGDVTHDGVVNGLDIADVASHWLQTGSVSLPGDVNGDGITNGLDLSAIASHWLQKAGSLALGPLTPPPAVEGQTFNNVTVYHFTDSNPAAKPSDYTAVVTLGNGNQVTLSSTATAFGRIVADSQGGFDVQLSYTYPKATQNLTFGVTVTSANGQGTSIRTDTFSVADAPLTAGALTPPVAIEGVAFQNLTVFHFTDADPAGVASDYTAIVTLGDGNTVTLTNALSPNGQIVSGANGGFDVQLSYNYAAPLTNQVFSVAVTDVGGASTAASISTFSVANSPFTPGSLTPPVATSSNPFSNVTVFQFTYDDSSVTAGSFSALVTLGNGSSVTLTSTPGANGQIVANASGGFDVQLSYNYPTGLSHQVFSVLVTGPNGLTVGASTSTFSVAWLASQFSPEVALDATNRATVGTIGGGAMLNAAQSQYLTEPDNPALDSLFNNTSQLTIEFQARQQTLGLDRSFLTKWNFGNNGTISISTGQHPGEEGEIVVWFATFNGDVSGTVTTIGANMQASVNYDIAFVFNAGQVQIYINGQLQSSYVSSGVIPTTLAASSNAALELGRWNNLGRYFDGAIDNLNMWTVAKTQAQIQSLQGDVIPYAQMTTTQRQGLVQSFPLTENSGPGVDAVNGYQMLNPTGVLREQIVTSWASTGSLPAYFVPSPEGQAPDYVSSVPSMNGQAALKFNGINDALKYASTQLPNESSGDVFIVAQFAGGGDNLEVDTLFSSASDTTAVDYFFFASYDPSTTQTPASEGGGTALPRLRFRDDTFQTDIRGSQVVIQPGVTYVLHFWGLGTAKGYGMTINGLNDSPFYTTSSPQDYATAAGSWFAASANRTNLTIGDFERSDGPQGFAAALISEIDVYAGTPSQPVLPQDVSQQIVNSLMTKYGATPLGNDG